MTFMKNRFLIAFALFAFCGAVNCRASDAVQPQDAAQTTTAPAAATPPAPATAAAAAAAPAPAAPAAPADAAPIGTPAMVGPLTANAPTMIDAGPFGKLAINGILSGFGVWQDNAVTGDGRATADISNGQVFIQKATGKAQFFLQAGAYNFPSLGTPILTTGNLTTGFYGPLPVAYAKWVPNAAFSVMAGKLPTLIGAEDTFSFQNINIERGLLWNQENAVNRGVQLNYTVKKWAASLAWNDGFYSDRWNWLTGSVAYTFNPANSLSFVAGGNLGHTGYNTLATPVAQNNSSIYNVIYTHTAKNWMVQPYFQYTHVPSYNQIGVSRTTSSQGEAILGTYTLPHHMFVTGRAEYISTTGSIGDGSANLLYGQGSNAGSITVTPTYQNKIFFARGEVSYVHAGSTTPGAAFGKNGTESSQVRGTLEAGFLF